MFDPLQFIAAIGLLAALGAALLGYAVWALVLAVTGIDPFAAYPVRQRQSRHRSARLARLRMRTRKGKIFAHLQKVTCICARHVAYCVCGPCRSAKRP